MRNVFIDTSAFYALIVADDTHHGRPQELFAHVQQEKWQLVATNTVVVEAHALFLHSARPGRETALRFLDMVQGDTYDVVRIREAISFDQDFCSYGRFAIL